MSLSVFHCMPSSVLFRVVGPAFFKQAVAAWFTCGPLVHKEAPPSDFVALLSSISRSHPCLRDTAPMAQVYSVSLVSWKPRRPKPIMSSWLFSHITAVSPVICVPCDSCPGHGLWNQACLHVGGNLAPGCSGTKYTTQLLVQFLLVGRAVEAALRLKLCDHPLGSASLPWLPSSLASAAPRLRQAAATSAGVTRWQG